MSEQQCAVKACDNPAKFRVEYTDSDTGTVHDRLVCRGCANDICEDCAATGMDFKARTLPVTTEQRP